MPGALASGKPFGVKILSIFENAVEQGLGEVLTAAHPGRESASQITIFRSLGLAVEDLASGQLVYERAVERGIGVSVDLAD